MKIRNGFVSNSSSSSFVLVGWAGSPSTELIHNLCELHDVENDQTELGDDWYELIEACGWICVKGYYGRNLMCFDDFEVIKLATSTIDSITHEAEEEAKVLGLEPPDIYGGTVES